MRTLQNSLRKYQITSMEVDYPNTEAAKTTRVYVFDSNQKPDLKSLQTLEDFSMSFLKSSQDQYPKGKNNLDQLKLEKTNGVKIGAKHKIENFYKDVPEGKTTYHNGYLKYLLTCWHNDCGAQIGPWHVWNIVLHQLCQHVKDNSAKYRDVFTSSSEKITITFMDGAMFDIDRFINELRSHVPVNIDTFVPQFPNQPPMYRESMYGLFADMVQEYYGCMILSCSIPKIRVLGSDGDWMALLDTVKSVNAFFTAKCVTVDYLTRSTSAIFEMIANLNNAEYWKNFFSVERCGSGSQEQIGGHVLKLLGRKGTYLVHDLPDMISRFPFVYAPGGSTKDMNFVSGVFFSQLDDDGYLVPEYHTNLTYNDSNLCKVTERGAQETEILIEFFKRMKKYDTDGGYVKNHLEFTDVPETFQRSFDYQQCVKGLQHIPIPDFDSYYAKRSHFDMGPKKDMLFTHKKKYDSNVHKFTIHNQRVTQSRGSLLQYLKLLAEHNATVRATKHYFWLGPDAVIKNPNNNERIWATDLPMLTVEKWLERLPLQADDVAFLQKNWDLIYDYIANNHFDIFKKYLFNMLNPTVFQMFFDSFQKKPFKFDWCSGGYCYTDPIVNKDADPYWQLVFRVFDTLPHWRSREAGIALAIKKELLPKDTDALKQIYVDALTTRMEGIMKRHYQDVEYYKENPKYASDYSKPENQVRDNSLKADIARLEDICSLTKTESNHLQIINAVLVKHNYDLKIDDAYINSKAN